ncbi:MAG: cyclic nucleotide-binding domain-containing protein [Gammaproteobacteria bacterium]
MQSSADFLDFLSDSPALGAFKPAQLEFLARHTRVERYQAGQQIFGQGQPANACFVLVAGKLALSFHPPIRAPDDQSVPSEEVLLRQFDDPGRLLGWSAMVAPYRYRATLSALETTRLLVLEREMLESRIQADPEFGVALMDRVIWTLGHRLRETRVRLVARRYDREVVAIQTLLDQSSESLHVDSALHKIPYCLSNRLTLADAFQALEVVSAHGDERERDLAALCLEILQQVRKELTLYQDLQHVYETVVSAPTDTPASEVRKRCCEEFIKLFERLDYVIEGSENLPDDRGHIFIMNHLFNHPANTLPNHFQLTLDTHFVSSMLILRKYGDAPVRVVRKSRADEFGHQKYYDRLGYIYVYAGDVDEPAGNATAHRGEQRNAFLEIARDCLLAGNNLVICPEGTSVATENSPVAMKSGAFRLAACVDPEPLIVPIAVANFDKNISRTRIAAIVCKPFRLSEYVSLPVADAELFDFVNQYRSRFAGYVRTAISLAGSKATA